MPPEKRGKGLGSTGVPWSHGSPGEPGSKSCSHAQEQPAASSGVRKEFFPPGRLAQVPGVFSPSSAALSTAPCQGSSGPFLASDSLLLQEQESSCALPPSASLPCASLAGEPQGPPCMRSPGGLLPCAKHGPLGKAAGAMLRQEGAAACRPAVPAIKAERWSPLPELLFVSRLSWSQPESISTGPGLILFLGPRAAPAHPARSGGVWQPLPCGAAGREGGREGGEQLCPPSLASTQPFPPGSGRVCRGRADLQPGGLVGAASSRRSCSPGERSSLAPCTPSRGPPPARPGDARGLHLCLLPWGPAHGPVGPALLPLGPCRCLHSLPRSKSHPLPGTSPGPCPQPPGAPRPPPRPDLPRRSAGPPAAQPSPAERSRAQPSGVEPSRAGRHGRAGRAALPAGAVRLLQPQVTVGRNRPLGTAHRALQLLVLLRSGGGARRPPAHGRGRWAAGEGHCQGPGSGGATRGSLCLWQRSP